MADSRWIFGSADDDGDAQAKTVHVARWRVASVSAAHRARGWALEIRHDGLVRSELRFRRLRVSGSGRAAAVRPGLAARA